MKRKKISTEVIESIRSGAVPEEERATLLVGADLSGVNLSGSNLSHFNLTGALLFKADLSGCEFFETNLSGVDATGANFDQSNMTEAKLVRTGLGYASFNKTTLFTANLSGATLTGANFVDADLRMAKLTNARLRETVLKNTDLTGALVNGADLCDADVTGAEFRDTNLKNSRLRGIKGYEEARWIGVDIREINFAGAYRVRRVIVDQNYLDEFRHQDSLHEVLYYIWWFTSDCGRSLGRWALLIAAQILLFAGIYSFLEFDYGPYLTRFSTIYFSVVTMTTLGFGDVVPKSMVAQVVVSIQVLSGYIMLGGLLSILTNKLARRAD